MTFTDADHDKAVELYGKYGKEGWWPVLVYNYDQGWTNWGDRVRDSVALSAIFAAMVDNLIRRNCEPCLRATQDGGSRVYLWDDRKHLSFDAPTAFLALADAVEEMDKGG